MRPLRATPGWLTVIALAAVAAVNLAGLWGIRVARQGALEEGRRAFALDVAARATDHIDLGVEGGWASLLGPQHDARHATLMIAAGWHGAP